MQIFRIVFQIITELLAAISYPLWRIFDSSIPVNHHAKHTILIVERWFNTNGIHKLWVNYLVSKGFQVYMVNFPIQRGTFEESAQKLHDYIQKQQLKNITLIGISGGGITSYLYLQHHNGWKHVKRFISIGSAFYGTPMALFISFIHSGRELLPNSTCIKQIKQEPIQHNERIINLAAQFDELVPRQNSLLPGAQHIIVDVIGHNNFHLDTKKTYEIITKLVDEK